MYKYVILLIVFSTFFTGCSTDEKTIGLKTETQHDDYFYSVTEFYKTDDIGGLKPNGVFYVVTFRVDNRAKRVNHPWDNSIAYVIDKQGREYRNTGDAQKKLNSIKAFNLIDKHVTQAGETETTVFVFDLPKDVQEPCLKYNGEFLMGDMFDGNQFKHTRVKLY